MGSSLAGELGLVYCTLVWGSTFFLIKDVLREVDPLVLVAYRFFIASLLLFPWVARRGRVLRLLKQGAVLAALLIITFVSQTMGLAYISASNSGFITGLFILFVPIFMYLFFRKRPTLPQCLAVGLALVGLWVLTGGVQEFNRGDALTLLCAVMVALHLLATDAFVKGEADAFLLAFHQFWITGVSCFAIALTTGASLKAGSVRSMGVIAFLGIFPTLSAYCIQMWAQKRTPPVRAALIFLLEPVWAAIFAWTVGGELFRARAAVGGLLILAAMATTELSKLSLRRGRKNEVLPI